MFKLLALLIGLCIAQSAMAQQSPALYMKFENRPDGSEIISNDQQNLQSSQSVSLMCVLAMSGHTGTPDLTYHIQGKMPDQDIYFDLLTSLTVSEDNKPIVLIMGPGVENAAKLNKALPVPPIWRIKIDVGRKGQTLGTVTGSLSCRVR